MVCTCSYEARKYGVSSCMSSAAAKNLCPDIVFLPVDFNNYGKISSNIFKLISKIISKIIISSIDEAYADITHINMETKLLIKKIKYVIKKYFNITCTTGVGPNKLMAKMATGINKPDWYYILDENSAISFIDLFPLSKAWGIGASAEAKLAGKEKLKTYFGNHRQKLYNAVQGIYEEYTETKLENKSISKTTTFSYDISSKQEIYDYMKILSEKVSEKLILKQYIAKVIIINWKTFRFESKSLLKLYMFLFFPVMIFLIMQK